MAMTITRSENMARIRSSSTAPERFLRRALWARGLRYRLNYDLPGRPDLVFVSRRLALFLDGCFWHGCPSHYSSPEVRGAFWARKLRANIERDLLVTDRLFSAGWCVIRVWQHEIDDNVRMKRLGELVAQDWSRPDLRPILQTLWGNNEAARPLDDTFKTPWYGCRCGSADSRVIAASGPGSLRPNAVRKPKCVELVCLRCRNIYLRDLLPSDTIA